MSAYGLYLTERNPKVIAWVHEWGLDTIDSEQMRTARNSEGLVIALSCAVVKSIKSNQSREYKSRAKPAAARHDFSKQKDSFRVACLQC